MEAALKDVVVLDKESRTAVVCSHCNGTGICPKEKCPICRAEGIIFEVWLCQLCKGSGTVSN